LIPANLCHQPGVRRQQKVKPQPFSYDQGLEQGVMSALRRGMSIEEIIAIFGLSRETIKTLLSKIEKEWSTTYQQPRADGWVGWIKERSDGSTDNGSGG